MALRNRFCISGPIGATLAVTLLLSTLVASCGTENSNGASSSWPQDVTRNVADDGRNVFVVKGLYDDVSAPRAIKNRDLRTFGITGARDSVEIDLQALTMTIVTPRADSTLATLVDSLAWYTAHSPTWSELLARDLRSDHFDTNTYRRSYQHELGDLNWARRFLQPRVLPDRDLEIRFADSNLRREGDLGVVAYRVRRTPTGEFTATATNADPPGWVHHSEAQEIAPADSVAVRLDNDRHYYTRLNPTTAHCKGEMRRALRVYDDHDTWVWQNQSDLWGRCHIVVHDFEDDGVDELVVVQHDHGQWRMFIYTR